MRAIAQLCRALSAVAAVVCSAQIFWLAGATVHERSHMIDRGAPPSVGRVLLDWTTAEMTGPVVTEQDLEADSARYLSSASPTAPAIFAVAQPGAFAPLVVSREESLLPIVRLQALATTDDPPYRRQVNESSPTNGAGGFLSFNTPPAHHDVARADSDMEAPGTTESALVGGGIASNFHSTLRICTDESRATQSLPTGSVAVTSVFTWHRYREAYEMPQNKYRANLL